MSSLAETESLPCFVSLEEVDGHSQTPTGASGLAGLTPSHSLPSSAAAPSTTFSRSTMKAPTKVVYHRAPGPGSGQRPPPEVYFEGDPRIDHLLASSRTSTAGFPEPWDALPGYGMAASPQHTGHCYGGCQNHPRGGGNVSSGRCGGSMSPPSLPRAVSASQRAASQPHHAGTRQRAPPVLTGGYSVPMPAYGAPWQAMVATPTYPGDPTPMGFRRQPYRSPTFSTASMPGNGHTEWQHLQHNARMALLTTPPGPEKCPEAAPEKIPALAALRSRSLVDMDLDRDEDAVDDGDYDDGGICIGCCGRDPPSAAKTAGSRRPVQPAKPMQAALEAAPAENSFAKSKAR